MNDHVIQEETEGRTSSLRSLGPAINTHTGIRRTSFSRVAFVSVKNDRDSSVVWTFIPGSSVLVLLVLLVPGVKEWFSSSSTGSKDPWVYPVEEELGKHAYFCRAEWARQPPVFSSLGRVLEVGKAQSSFLPSGQCCRTWSRSQRESTGAPIFLVVTSELLLETGISIYHGKLFSPFLLLPPLNTLNPNFSRSLWVVWGTLFSTWFWILFYIK